MLKKTTLLILSIICLYKTDAQKIILYENVLLDTLPELIGPNFKHFSHFYVSYGYVIGNSNAGSKIEYDKSNSIYLGYRYKKKISQFYDYGLQLDYNCKTFRIDQNNFKRLPDNVLHDKEFLRFNSINLEYYNRINFNKRGNRIGKFMDIGVYGDWPFLINHIYKDRKLFQNSGKTIVINKDLKYVSPFNYGLSTRLGSNRIVLFGYYRISNIFKESPENPNSSFFPELPRGIIGIQLGLY